MSHWISQYDSVISQFKGVFVYIMVFVKKQPGQSDDALIRGFSKKVMDAGIVQEAKRRKFYLKPSLAKKLRKKMKQEEAARVKLF